MQIPIVRLTTAAFAMSVLLWGIPLMSSQAADRALLIGVGKYKQEKHNLPGIDKDIATMQQVAQSWGFQPAHIKVLMDEQATLANVEAELDTLQKSVGEHDRVLVYFSGHGTRVPDVNGDETDDGVDEVLVLHDTTFTEPDTKGQKFLLNVLLDDNFGTWITGVLSRLVMIVVDACHSGSVTKEMDSKGFARVDLVTVQPGKDHQKLYEKFFEYEGMPMTVSKGTFKPKFRDRDPKTLNYVSITAAGDHEKAVATETGSLFTVGLYQATQAFQQRKASPTPQLIRDEVAVFIKQNVPEQSLFTPQLSGNETLFNKPLSSESRSFWDLLTQVVNEANRLDIKINQPAFAKGETLTLFLQIPRAGYLNVVNVNAADEPTILFPNQYHSNNAVVPGQFAIPTDQMQFELPAEEPFGRSLLVALLTSKPLNLYETERTASASGMSQDKVFEILTQKGWAHTDQTFVRSFGVRQKQSAVSGGNTSDGNTSSGNPINNAGIVDNAGMVETKVCATSIECR